MSSATAATKAIIRPVLPLELLDSDEVLTPAGTVWVVTGAVGLEVAAPWEAFGVVVGVAV